MCKLSFGRMRGGTDVQQKQRGDDCQDARYPKLTQITTAAVPVSGVDRFSANKLDSSRAGPGHGKDSRRLRFSSVGWDIWGKSLVLV
jgi:hypothetical protein